MMIISVVVFMARRLLQRRQAVHAYPTELTVRPSKPSRRNRPGLNPGMPRVVRGVNLSREAAKRAQASKVSEPDRRPYETCDAWHSAHGTWHFPEIIRMGWELRRGKLVYYRKMRDGGRVRSVYCGSGERGERAAREDEERRDAKRAAATPVTCATPEAASKKLEKPRTPNAPAPGRSVPSPRPLRYEEWRALRLRGGTF